MWHWGVIALYGLLLLIVLTAFRKTLRSPYELWQSSHGVISTAVVLFALIHAFMIA